MPRTPSARNKAITVNAPSKTELLTDDGEDEVRVREGQEAPLGAALAESRADQPAVRHPDLRLDRLVAGVERIGPRVSEAHEPPVAVRLDDGEQPRQRCTGAGGHGQRLQRCSGHEQHHEHDDAEDDRGTQVGLQHDQARDEYEDGEDGSKRDARVLDAVARDARAGRRRR